MGETDRINKILWKNLVGNVVVNLKRMDVMKEFSTDEWKNEMRINCFNEL